MRKFILMFSALMLCIGVAFGQGKTISGQVIDNANNESVIGATIQVKGAEASGTITDFDGNFTITLPDGFNTLVVSYVGYETMEVEAKNGMVIRMSTASEMLDEVMVVAYGTSTKKSFSGSATVVKGETLEKKNPSEVTKALAGEIAGVQVVSSTGQPGSSASIRIRGIGSVNSSTDPLYIVDGVPYQGDISSIDPSDIASTTVLKDATATSLYGSRGSNGVILITTKKGTSGESGRIDIDVKYGANMRLIPLYNTVTDYNDYLSYVWEGIKNSAGGSGKIATNNLFNLNGGGLPAHYNRWTIDKPITENGTFAPNLDSFLKPGYKEDGLPAADEWKKALFRNGQKLDATLKIHGGSDKTTYYSSFGYLKDEGYYIGSDYSRLSSRLNVDHQAKKWLRGNVNMAYSYSTFNNPGQSSNMNNGFAYVNECPPIYSVFQRDKDGYLVEDPKMPVDPKTGRRPYAYDYGDIDVNGQAIGRLYGNGINPAGALLYDKQNTIQHQFTGNAMLEVTFYKGLKFTTNFGLQYVGQMQSSLTNNYYGDAANVGRIYKNGLNYLAYTFNQLLTYTNDFGGDHNLSALLGHETTYDAQSVFGGAKNFIARPDGLELGNAIEMSQVDSYSAKVTLESYFAQVRYSYKDRYFFDGSLRYDGSSRFAKGHRWGLFGAVGVAWMISNEDFMRDVEVLRNMKIKASWGRLGNQAVSTFLYTNWYGINNVEGNIGYILGYIGNPDLTWETTGKVNAGIEFSLSKYFDASIDYFYHNTFNMLMPRAVAPSLGYSSFYVNDAALINQGVEFQFDVHAVNTNAVKLDIRLNGAHYQNKVTKMPKNNRGEVMDMNGGMSLGHSLYDFYMTEFAGVNSETGVAEYTVFYDKNKGVTEGSFDLYKDGILSVHQYLLETYGPNAEKEEDKLSPEELKKLLADPVGYGYLGKTKTDKAQYASNFYVGKSAIPVLAGGFGIDLSVYGVELAASFQYQFGGYGQDLSYQMLMHSDRGGSQNWHKDIENRWQQPGDITDVPRLSNGADTYANTSSTRFLIKSDYLALSNVRIGYSFPKKMIEKIKLNTLSLFVSGDNLFCLSYRQGYVPMASFVGSSSTYQYTPLSTFMGGIRISF